ncbi:hypothetical protein Cgig2_017505 [Carnegiea gigantea]|uniref:Uncharacterized protein n=1 Tax=Carnegiea gigantea TaxID=171969 RepID=A0A9Q1GPQ3_9CARY|nr:hypothetical protein Cgig2_017505 [Carnegiea gigantea]
MCSDSCCITSRPIKVFLKRSSQSRLNKTTGPKAVTRHTQGFISAAAIAKKMRKGGKIVIVAKLFSKTHTKPKDKTFADDRSKAAWEKYPSLKLAKQVPPSEEDDSHFLEAVRVWSEKDTVYGLGNSVNLFYEKPTNNVTANKPSYTPLSLHNSRLN